MRLLRVGQFFGLECTRVWHLWVGEAAKCREQSLMDCLSGSLQGKDVERNVDSGDYPREVSEGNRDSTRDRDYWCDALAKTVCAD